MEEASITRSGHTGVGSEMIRDPGDKQTEAQPGWRAVPLLLLLGTPHTLGRRRHSERRTLLRKAPKNVRKTRQPGVAAIEDVPRCGLADTTSEPKRRQKVANAVPTWGSSRAHSQQARHVSLQFYTNGIAKHLKESAVSSSSGAAR